MCTVAARESIYDIDNFEARCRRIANGVMTTGLSNAILVIYQFLGDAERRVQPFDKTTEFYAAFLGQEEGIELLDAMEFFIGPVLVIL